MKLSVACISRRSRWFVPGIKLAICTVLALVPLYLNFSVSAEYQVTDPTEFFEKKVRPVLAANCQTCHNQKSKLAELDLTTAEGFAKGGESGPLIDSARLTESRLLKVISYHEKLKMPPGGKLKDEEIGVLTQWVEMGAPWPGGSTASAEKSRKPGRTLTESEKKFWAFQKVSAARPPQVRNLPWVKSPIDRFLLAKLESAGLQPARPADRETLLRRATFDLTGLPPTPAEIRSFLADTSPNAFATVVDKLLSSPRYGERWGRHWLDVARFADSTGNDEDHRYPHAWRYRDWVIKSFNSDQPYNEFVRDQIAGDLLPGKDGDAADGVNKNGIIATGFLSLGPKALAQQDKTKMLYDVYDEQVDVTSKAFLGLTVACARCHDHKFDPILTRDYYSLTSIFASTRSFKDAKAFVSEPLDKPLVSKAAFDVYLTAKRAHDDLVKRNRYEIESILEAAKQPAVRKAASDLALIMKAAWRVYADSGDMAREAERVGIGSDDLKRWVEYLRPGKPREHLLAWHQAPVEDVTSVALRYQERFSKQLDEWDRRLIAWRKKYDDAIQSNKSPLPDKPSFEPGHNRFFAQVMFGKEGPLALNEEGEAKLPADVQQRLKTLREKREELKRKAPEEPPMACAVEDGEPVSQRVFVRGDYHNAGEEVPKAFPVVLTSSVSPPDIEKGSGRLQLAEWLTQPNHPLTARVMVNRIWGWHFGEGLVRTPDNFGKTGDPPSHPELLDYLAHRFVNGAWSIKAMHRLIMLSSAYQLSATPTKAALTKDPENRLLSHFNRRRLSVEEMRDGLLAIGGSLDLTMGGTLQRGTGTDGENDNKRLSLNPEKLNRRTVYLPLRRANLPALLNLFDFGDATTVNGRRQLTNVPTQALFWLNSEFLTERSTNLAKTLLAIKSLNESQLIAESYLRVLGRRPSLVESAEARKYLAGYRARFSAKETELKAWSSLCRVLMTANDFNYVD